jgi:uncharacterized Rmd1/YagE family protein
MSEPSDNQEDHEPEIHRCVAYCTAASYNLKELLDSLKVFYKAVSYRDVVYFDLSTHISEVKDAFCFSYGAVVLWGLNEVEEQQFLKKLTNFQRDGFDLYERERMSFTTSSTATAKIVDEVIELPDNDMLLRLAISHGLAQSVRLATFENIIQKTINKTRHIPEQLASRGKIPLSKKEIRRKMGELFLERSSVNLHFDILDTPEFFWDHSDLEPLYVMIANHLDLETRVQVLNQRLDIVHDLFEMLGNELNHQHSSKLEWIIIWLIVIEVVLTITKDIFKVA